MATEHELERAREYVLSGHYGLAEDLLTDREDRTAPDDERTLLLRAEIALRRDPVSALELLARVSDLFDSAEGRFGYYLTSGKAYAQSRNFAAAGDMFAAAGAIAADGHPRGAAELAYHQARLQWLRHEYDPDSAALLRAMAAEDPGIRFEAHAVRSWMYAGLGRYSAQLAELVTAIGIADEHFQRCDVRAAGRVLHTLFRLALEVGDTAATAAGERVLARIVWTDDLREERFLVLRALAWDAFLRGQTARAQWLFRDSKEIAPSAAWKVMAHVDRSFVARYSGNQAWATDELFEAHALARTVAWAETHGEERLALAMLAVLFAPVDMAQAQHYVSTSIRLGVDNVDASLGITQDRRAEGYALYAAGRVQQVLGNAAGAKNALDAAYEIFVHAGYDFRAALVADALATLSGDAKWTELARLHAGRFPASAFYAYLCAPPAAEGDALAGLSPLQRQLAAALCEGLDVAQISHRFSRSEFTVRRETNALYERLGVRTLSELRERCEGRAV